MAKVFFTSDLHFGHKNLCEGLRGMTAEESDALIISNWNKVVSKRDIVYVLGDITMEKHKNIKDYISKLNGHIRIVGGNHDNVRCCHEYRELGITVMGVLIYKNYICTHIPIHESQLYGFAGNIHGHIHRQGEIDGLGHYTPATLDPTKYYNVNTEFHSFTPIEFEQIKKEFACADTN